MWGKWGRVDGQFRPRAQDKDGPRFPTQLRELACSRLTLLVQRDRYTMNNGDPVRISPDFFGFFISPHHVDTSHPR